MGKYKTIYGKIKGEDKMKTEAQIKKLFGGITERLMEVYVLFYICLFPLCMHDKYYDVLHFHFKIFWKPTIAYFVGFLIIGLLFLFCDALYNHGAIRRSYFDKLNKDEMSDTKGAKKANEEKNNFEAKKKWKICEVLKVGSLDISITVFLLILIISTIFAEYPYEAFWGDRGRYQGLLLWLMFYIAYWLVTRFYKFKKWHIFAYMGFASLVCMWGISNFFLNTYGMFEGTNDIFKYTFVSSIGNINTYTAFTGILYGVSVGMFISSEKLGTTIYAYIVVLIASFAHIMGLSDNAVLSMGIVLVAAPLLLWKSYKNVTKYFLVVTTYIAAMKITSLITLSGIGTMNDLDPSFQITFAGKEFFAKLIVVSVVLTMFFFGLAIKEHKGTKKINKKNINTEETVKLNTDNSKNSSKAVITGENTKSQEMVVKDEKSVIKKLKFAWCGVIVLVVAAIITVLVLANTGWHAELWAPYSNMLIFNDSWGTGRGLVWRLGMEYWHNDATLISKLFGYGPDTFYIITMDRFMNIMQNAGYGMFDSAHNEYFEYFITIGIFGLLAYVVFMITALKELFKDGVYSKIIGLAVLAYACQALVNIAVPIITPVLMIFMFAGIKVSKDSKIVRKS
ncbi:hypothetical protein BXO88_01225 [Oribacterium sp. C9]|uniref:O-antigen ligase family protein n=1 Tax=Oribacterium sp. C9 TaxID=1943579 RepID=UPI0009C97810|nr:O-antigen ligase family protein [Oribacterium sp. C9]OON88443.1 hypothetical protein BXO88_01225 [Oribacterium sp. C9]